jgi:hypothetical protein
VCSSGLVEPLYWNQTGPDCWRLDLRCPECGTLRTATFDGETVHSYNVLLYAATEQVARQADALGDEWAAAVLAEEQDFVAALNADEILPMDF